MKRSSNIIGPILRVTFRPIWCMVVEKSSFDPLKTYKSNDYTPFEIKLITM